VKLKNLEVFQAVQFMKELQQQPWPVKTSLAVGDLSKALADAWEVPDKVRSGLVSQHAKELPNKILPEHENWPAFAAEYNELMDTEIDIDFVKVTLPMEVNGQEPVISHNAIEALKPFAAFAG